MDETANQIEAHIDRTRERLGSNLRELEDKVAAATDWREHFRERPYAFLGAAFVGAMVVGGVLGSRSAGRSGSSGPVGPTAGSRVRLPQLPPQARDLWNNIQGALIGVATARLTGYIGELVPGFEEHYRGTGQRAAPGDSTRS